MATSALVAATVLAPVGTGPAVAQSYRFNAVDIQGNQRIEQATILSYAGIARGQSLSAAELNDVYQRLMGSGLFESVSIEPRGGTLVIAVQEFPTINVISFEGNKRIKTEDLQKIIKSQSRRIYSPSQAEADAALVTEAYSVQGRMAARVTPKIIRRSDNRVDLVFEIAEGRVTEIERLSFVGNRAFTDRRLRQVLETKQAGLLRNFIRRDTYAAERIEIDKQMLRDFYLSRGYVDFQVLDATAELQPGRDGFFLTFSVREGQQFRFGRIGTVSEIPEADADEFGRLVRIREGSVYTPLDIENAISRIESLALRKGINFLRVDPRVTRNDRDQTLDVTFALVRGPRVFIERIDIEGNATTLDQVIRRQFRTVEGDPFNPREIREAAERIRALGFFETAAVDTRQGTGPDQVIVKAQVEEKPTGSLTFGASFGSSSGGGAVVGLSESNFLGRGQFLSLDLNFGADNATSSFTFTEPAFLGRDLSFTFGALYRETEANYATFDTREAHIRPSIGFPTGERTRLDLRYTLAESKIYRVDPVESSAILVREEGMGGVKSSALGYAFSWDTRRSGLTDRNAFVLKFEQDFAGLGADQKYIRSIASAIAETKVWNEEVTLRATLEGGALNMLSGGTSRVVDRFEMSGRMRGFEPYGLGPRDLRATNEDPLGGNMFVVARFDAEFPLGLPEEYGIRGGAFLDVGSLWGLDDTDGGGVDDSFKLRSAIGVSLLWDTPIGPLRFNFARPIKKETYDKKQTFDLSISTRF
ncbi:outer membrane protein assembly factor BamA [Xinfangfangia sp. LG-4]|uniref:Outer membrane protein assembly factor BamA n=2 Tax=Ruixingdingia sedimenti TaxID=3073604 RepID=A0ABU1F928_9RHOB|nr:outer membrane protein assembly factor BamA [Xinfangfangia sp. LG-4]MDR5652952.1 outer membrane protein assembly factor BamA [Xinfangfangia sp. LG-4]